MALFCSTQLFWNWKIGKFRRKHESIPEGHTQILLCISHRSNIKINPPEAVKVATFSNTAMLKNLGV